MLEINFWRKYNLWISAAVFLAAVFLIWFFVMSPLRKSIEANADEIQKKNIDSDIYKERVQKIPEMEKMQTTFDANRNNLKIFLNGSSEVDFIKKIESVAEETGNRITLKIEENTDQKTKKTDEKKDETDIKNALPGNNKYVTIQISLEGNYENLFNFIRKLENINYYVNVISLDLNKDIVEKEANPFTSADAKKTGGNIEKEVIKSNLEAIVYLEAE